MVELSRSLYTSDYKEARRRCLLATAWFRSTIEKLSTMSSPSRADLETAAVEFFHSLAREIDSREPLDRSNLADEVDFNLEASREAILQLDQQLIANEFDAAVTIKAEDLLAPIGKNLSELSPAERQLTLQLAARAHREQLELLVHTLTSPANSYHHLDQLFAVRPSITTVRTNPINLPNEEAFAGLPLKRAADLYLARKTARKVSTSHIDELARALGWLQERFGEAAPVGEISKRDVAKFRDDIARRDVSFRGQRMPFDAQLTNDPDKQISSVTAQRYFKSVQSFFAWAHEDGHSPDNPAAGLKLEPKRGERRNSPEAFSKAELQRLFKSPLYGGYKSWHRVSHPGECTGREGHWWSGILALFTGLRAGELSQLLPGDFDFSAEVPHLKVRRVDETGATIKSTKTDGSVRDVPLAPVLLQLGLAEFVAQRAKVDRKRRVLHEFNLGSRGRTSDGMTKFWGAYLRAHDLWKPGRSTHVWRHTLIANLRANGVPIEDIAAFVGHKQQSVTASYGGDYPLERKLKTALAIDYGFDVISAAGGDYDVKRHR